MSAASSVSPSAAPHAARRDATCQKRRSKRESISKAVFVLVGKSQPPPQTHPSRKRALALSDDFFISKEATALWRLCVGNVHVTRAERDVEPRAKARALDLGRGRASHGASPLLEELAPASFRCRQQLRTQQRILALQLFFLDKTELCVHLEFLQLPLILRLVTRHQTFSPEATPEPSPQILQQGNEAVSRSPEICISFFDARNFERRSQITLQKSATSARALPPLHRKHNTQNRRQRASVGIKTRSA